MSLKRSIRSWRKDAEHWYRQGLSDGLSQRGQRVAADRLGPAGRMSYEAGHAMAEKARRGKWPIATELPDKVWARILARKLRQV